jgi:hypothetical protein
MQRTWVEPMQQWLHTHAGILPIAQLVAMGCPQRDAYRLLATDEFEYVMPGILRSKHWPLGADQRMMAACLRSPAAVIAWTTAAKHWKFRSLPADDGEVHVLVPHGRSPLMPEVVVHRSRRIDPVDVVNLRSGLRLTSPARTLFDCADLLGRKRTSSILEQIINDGKGGLATHVETFGRLGRPGRPGTRTMAAVIGARPTWRAAVQSELELQVLNEIECQGLPTPVVQMWVELPNGARIRLDFAWPDQRVDLEVDHPFWHAGADASHRDKTRDRKLGTLGWQTVRMTEVDVAGGLAAAVRDVAIVLSRR